MGEMLRGVLGGGVMERLLVMGIWVGGVDCQWSV